MVEIFKALAEESRLRIISLLMEREMCVCEIEFCLKMTQSNASRHLTALKKCGILEGYKRAQWAYYRINENFKRENNELWEYLQMNLRELSTYRIDCRECDRCKEKDICSSSISPH
ncbi:MAG: transcriptional regulator [Clostridiales bacterium]|jgi:ArsR family transcriptional regulator|nr:transcriptional regulator [Clostridiales bacterium]